MCFLRLKVINFKSFWSCVKEKQVEVEVKIITNKPKMAQYSKIKMLFALK